MNTWNRAIMHLDMDAFYVNVHILDNAQDKGLPLVIGGRPDQRGVVASASYEARKLGIHSAMPTSRAVRLCGQLKIVPANWSRIRECSKQVMDILREFGPVEQISVDEAYVDLSANTDPQILAAQIRATVKSTTNLPCSIGLASSKLVAKVASDHEKPEGFTVVPPNTEADFLAPLSVRVIWGIGPRTAERLAALKINRCGELAAADPGVVQAAFGNQGPHLQRRARGIDNRPIQTDHGPSKSISQEWTFNIDISDAVVLQDKLQQMCQKVTKSLQRQTLMAQTIYVKFRWSDFTTFTRQRSVSVPIDQEAEIYRLALAIWREHWPPGRPMRLLGVGVSNLKDTSARQLSFNFDGM